MRLPNRSPRKTAGIVAAVLCVGVSVGLGCNSPKRRAAKPTQKEKAAPESDLPGKVTGKGWHIRWRTPNLKNPKAEPWRVMEANARRGALADENRNATVRLAQVLARLYREGIPAAVMKADQVMANQTERIVVATGNVYFQSLPSPSETVVRADKITWDTRTNELVAVGNTYLNHQPRKRGLPLVQSGGRVTFDTKLDEFKVE